MSIEGVFRRYGALRDRLQEMIDDVKLEYTNTSVYNDQKCLNSLGLSMVIHPSVLMVVMFYVLAAVPFGLLGNTLSFIIMARGARKMKTRLYLCVLALTDNVAIVAFGILGVFSMYGSVFARYFDLSFDPVLRVINRPYVCQLRVFLGFASRLFSMSIVALFSMERMMVINFPFTRRFFTYKRTTLALALLLVYSCLMSVHIFFTFVSQYGKVCKPDEGFFRWNYLDLMGHQIVPSVVVLASNITILMRLRNRFTGANFSSSIKRRDEPTGGSEKPVNTSSYRSEISEKLDAKKARQEMRITRRLLLVSITMLATTIPQIVIAFVRNRQAKKCAIFGAIDPLSSGFTITLVIFNMNFVVNFLLYCLTSKAFFHQATALLCCRYMRYRQLVSSTERPVHKQRKKSNRKPAKTPDVPVDQAETAATIVPKVDDNECEKSSEESLTGDLVSGDESDWPGEGEDGDANAKPIKKRNVFSRVTLRAFRKSSVQNVEYIDLPSTDN